MISKFLTSTGRVNSAKLNPNWLNRNMPELVEQLKTTYPFEGRLVEKIWMISNGVISRPLCKHCKLKPTKFKGLLDGYAEFCSTSCHNKSSSSIEKKLKSYQLKYGVDNPFQSEEIKNKIKIASINRYGVENPAQADSIKEKVKSTNRQKYGTDWGLSGESSVRKLMDSRARDAFKKMCETRGISVKSWSSNKFGIIECTCNKGHEFKLNKWQIYQRAKISMTEICTVCNPIGSFSETSLEKIVSSWLDEFGVKYSQRDRTILNGQELDIVVNSNKIAFEMNGVYWHSDNFKDIKYHSNKTQSVEAAGLQLIHVWEDQLQNSEQILKSMIATRLGLTKNRIPARLCDLVELSSSETAKFFEENHLQGNSPAKIKLGLKFNGQLVAAMTFGSLRKSLGGKAEEGSFEMYRFANKLDTTVVGGASKLLKGFIRRHSPERIISFAMKDWSTGNMYKKLGFTEIKRTGPSYWYIEKSNLTRYHRFSFRKDVLVKNGADSTLSEYQIMNSMNYYRIWDSGQILFEWRSA